MTSPAQTVYLALDAVDLDLAQRMAAAGELPNLARVLRSGASVETKAPVGYFVSAHWPSMYTGLGPSRHGYLSWDEIRGGTY
jgi:predicted AlkP superfamily phosphohydrolase/phosphomutase